jgi:metallo-beta-lactamase family protein
LRFLGATGTVTGSRFLVDAPGARVLVDCGIFQGLKALRERNWTAFPVDPATVDALVLTHAHLDHSGYAPALARNGFAGRIFATHGTRDLSRILWPDSGRLQEEDAEYENRKGYSKHDPALPLFTEEDGRRLANHVTAVSFGNPVDVARGVRATFRRAGHILGSATIVLELERATIAFSGDLGRLAHPILLPPEPLVSCDTLLVESTYGDQRHADLESLERFEDAVVRTSRRGGAIVIPCFAVDRTEVVLFHLRRLVGAGRVPDLPVYVDSPMALDGLEIYRTAVSAGSPEIRPELRSEGDPFNPGHLIETRTVPESMTINTQPLPAIIIAAAGMATGGRVLHHLRRRLPDPKNTVILVGFQAEGTRGRALLEGARAVKMLGQYVPVRAEIVNVPAFSVHADQPELLAWLRTAPRPPDTVFVVHGEPRAAEALRSAIQADLGWTAAVPRHLEQVRLG